jgi:membrane protease YdiL (CAAX protease family)
VLQGLADGVAALLAWTRARPLLAFLVTAICFSWADWVSLAWAGSSVVPGRLPTDMAGMAGPAFAALAVSAIGGGEAGVKDLLRRVVRLPLRSPWLWLLAPAPLWTLLLALGVMWLAGLEVPGAGTFGRYPGLPPLPPLAVFDLVLLGVGFGQEIGWRGLALPRLQARHGPFAGAVAVSVPWGIWMAPLLVVNRWWMEPGQDPLAVLLAAGALLVSSSIVLAFLVARTGGSIAAAAIWHACLRMATATEGARGLPGAVVAAAVVVAASVVVVAEVRARRAGETVMLPPRQAASARRAARRGA